MWEMKKKLKIEMNWIDNFYHDAYFTLKNVNTFEEAVYMEILGLQN